MKITFRNGLIVAAIVIILHVIVSLASLQKVDFTGFLVLLSFVYFIYQAGVYVRHEQHGLLTYGEAFNTGMGVTFWAALVSAVLLYSIYKFIDHDTVRMVQQQIPDILDRQNVPDEQREALQDTLTRVFGPGGLAIVDFIKYILLGLIVSLIVAAFIRREGLPLEAESEHPVPPAEE